MPNPTGIRQPIIYTNKARCRDCYRCLRACPVKAIKIENNQASIEENLCIACGTCIRECPQKAKTYRHDTESVFERLEGKDKVVLSLAPSILSLFSQWELMRLPSACRALGFDYVGLTSVGAQATAWFTAQHIQKNPDQLTICSACPAVVNWIEHYHPQFVPALVPVLSPMIAHAKHLKTRLGSQTTVVFAGPCIAKKAEAERDSVVGYVDFVLTFEELISMLEAKNIALSECEDSSFDDPDLTDARYFPLAGGLFQTAGISTDLLDDRYVALSGFQSLDAFLSSQNLASRMVIEPLFCTEGCVNGPAFPSTHTFFERKNQLLNAIKKSPSHQVSPNAIQFQTEDKAFYQTSFLPQDVSIHETEFTPEAIQTVLTQTGKLTPEDQLNCGACGYTSCHDKAIAVLRHMAEPQMCIPYMRKLAEKRTDLIIETSPNGIVILDKQLEVVGINPAFKSFFNCTDAVIGKKIATIIDPEPFEKLTSGQLAIVDETVSYPESKMICHLLCYALPQENQFVGIFVNMTHLRNTQAEITTIKTKTIERSLELLDHQISMAQKIAKLLGENTAIGEELVQNLLKLSEPAPNQDAL